MKIKLIYSLVCFLCLLLITCSEKITDVAAFHNGELMEDETNVPFTLEQNYPNPFNPSTAIHFSVSTPMYLKMTVFSEDWQKVVIIIDSDCSMGFHVVTFDGRNEKGDILPSGEYFYVLEGGGYKLVRKMKLLK